MSGLLGVPASEIVAFFASTQLFEQEQVDLFDIVPVSSVIQREAAEIIDSKIHRLGMGGSESGAISFAPVAISKVVQRFSHLISSDFGIGSRYFRFDASTTLVLHARVIIEPMLTLVLIVSIVCFSSSRCSPISPALLSRSSLSPSVENDSTLAASRTAASALCF